MGNLLPCAIVTVTVLYLSSWDAAALRIDYMPQDWWISATRTGLAHYFLPIFKVGGTLPETTTLVEQNGNQNHN
jgi:hypothetical protein